MPLRIPCVRDLVRRCVASMRLALAAVFLLAPCLGQAGGDGAIGVAPGLDGDAWSDIRQAREEHRHAAVATPQGHRARNPGQRWRSEFDGRGVTLVPDAGDFTWGLELVRYGFAARERELASPTRTTAAGRRVVYAWDDTLEEWYVNRDRGLEHGYTVLRRPPGEGDLEDGPEPGPLCFTLAVRGGLWPEVDADGRGVRFVGERGEARLRYTGLAVFDARGRSLPASFERAPEGLRLLVDEAGASYPLTVDPVAQQAYLKASNTGAGDYFGWSVAVFGDTVAVGAPYEDSAAVGVDGDGSDDSATNSGAVYVFVRTGSGWSQQAYLKASQTDPGDRFGSSLALSADTLVVGAPGEDSGADGVDGDGDDDGAPNSGAAYVFRRSAGVWSQEAYVKASNSDAGDQFASSVALSADTLLVGALSEDGSATAVNGDSSDNGAGDAGAAYVFTRSGTSWSEAAYLKAPNTDAGDHFGISVAVSGDTAVVGARDEDGGAVGVDGDPASNGAPQAGAAYVFAHSGGSWSHEAYLKASNTDAEDRFGVAVAASGDTVAVGALAEDSKATGVQGDESDNSLTGAGAVYVFARSGTTWTQQAYVKPLVIGSIDEFGGALALSGERLIVGAMREDSASAGVGGDPDDNSATLAGAAYLFERSGTSWMQTAFLKASNAQFQDRFGFSVALAGSSAVVGAFREDSAATGAGGDQADGSMSDAGAAYAFDLQSAVRPFCVQSKPTSVAGCSALLSVTGPSIASDSWLLQDVPLGPATDRTFGLFLYTSGPGGGLSTASTGTPFGTLCLGGALRSAPPCAALALSGAPGSCGNVFPAFSPDCAAGALGIRAGDDVNVQAWYRDPDVGPAGANFSNAVFYTATP